MAITALPGRGHEPRPKKGTTRSVKTGQPAELMDKSAYPMSAECAECGGRITSAGFFMAFYHDTPP